jgi:hypothetical protein
MRPAISAGYQIRRDGVQTACALAQGGEALIVAEETRASSVEKLNGRVLKEYRRRRLAPAFVEPALPVFTPATVVGLLDGYAGTIRAAGRSNGRP